MKKILFVLLVVALVLSLSVSVFAAGEQPSGSSYTMPLSYSGSTTSSSNFWTAMNNSVMGIWYRIGSTTQSNSILYLLNAIKNNTASGGGSVSSAWTASDVTTVKNYLNNISTNANYLDDIMGYTHTSANKLIDIAAWEVFIQSISNNVGIIKNNTVNLDDKLDDIISNTSDTAGNTFNLMTRFHYLDSAAWDEGGVGFSPDSWWYNMYLRLFGTYIEATGIHDDTTAILPHTESIDTTTQNLLSLLSHDPEHYQRFTYLERTGNTNFAVRSNINTVPVQVTRDPTGKLLVSSFGDAENLMDYLNVMNNNLVNLSLSQMTCGALYRYWIDYAHDGVVDTDEFVAGSIADFLVYTLPDIDSYASRLSYMLADDDDLALKHAQSDNIHAVSSDFLSGQDSPTSIGVGSIGAVKGFGDSLHEIFSVGSVNPGSFLGILSATDAWAFFTNQTKTDIGMTGSQRRMLKSSAFSDLDSSGVSVEVTNYYQQNIDDLHDYLEVMSYD